MKVFLKDIVERYPEFEILNYDESAYFTSFNHDSRAINEGDLFIPIVGDRFDGHDFINDALCNGANMSLCENSKYSVITETNKPIILVDSIEEGLEKILNFAISPITAPVVGVTGSTGKTTTKQMLITILQSQKNVLFSDKSNTVWGNAAVLSKYKDEDFVILEFGMDRAGEIAWHCNSVDPDLGILLNIGHVHAEMLGGIEAVYNEKKNIADYLDKCGKPLVLNIDDDRLIRIQKEYKSELVTFGKHKDATFRFDNVVVGEGGINFELYFNGNVFNVHVNVFGEDLAYNAVAAIAAAYSLGINIDDAVNAISYFEPNSGRFEILDMSPRVIVVNDAYNANPTSMNMSLKTFNRLYPPNIFHRIAVLGDMRELGDVSKEKHNELGRMVSGFSFDEVYYMGNYFDDFGFGKEVNSPDEVAALLSNRIEEVKDKKIAILLKASNSLKVYLVPDFLRKLGIS